MTTLLESVEQVKNGHTTVEKITNNALENINGNEEYNAFITIYNEKSLERAKHIDDKVRSGKAGKLAGCVIGIKDNICVKDETVTCGSRILKNYISPYSATAVEKLEKEDAVIIGKTNLDEFAMGSSNENSFFGHVKNPVDMERVPGGSSGGSAASVAGGLVPVALGSDTGGSIRQPAAFCGISALKPTYGRISRFGLVAFASSLDQIGPFAKNSEDLALILRTICGHDAKDSTSVDMAVPDFQADLKSEVPRFKIGVFKDLYSDGIDPEITSGIVNIIDKLKADGFSIGEIDLPHSVYSVATYYIIANAEASSNLARYDGARYGYRASGVEDLNEMYVNSRSEGFGDEVKRRIILGTFVLNAGYYDAYYAKAQKVRRLIYDDFNTVFNDYDLILSPTTPSTAFKIGEKIDNPLEMYLNDIFTIPINLAGLPAMSLPCGKSSSGHPIGLQIIGKHFDESAVLKLGKHIEQYN